MSARRAVVFFRVATGVAGLAALVACLFGIVGAITGAVAPLWAIGLIVAAVVAAWVANRLAGIAIHASMEVVLEAFLGAVDAGDHAAAHRLLYPATRNRLSAEDLAGEFPDRMAGGRIVRSQFTRNATRGHAVRRLAKVAVRLRIRADVPVDYLFFLVQEGRTWTVDQWVAGGVWDLIDYQFE